MMSDLPALALVVITVISVICAVYFWYVQVETVRRLNRRLVAYEGKLRDLGHEPERVYHDFENMLEGGSGERQAEEFDSDVRYSEEKDD